MGVNQYTFDDYLVYVLMSHKKRLLVEGPSDYLLFARLIHAFPEKANQIDIDDASCLISFDHAVGNREKVEMICAALKGKKFANKLTGFVDREFRGFTVTPDLQDNLNDHKVDGRLIWSRGHSVENYYFDLKILNGPIRTLSTTRYYQLALDLFEENFEKIMRIACSSSLLGLEINNSTIIRSAISWKVLEVEDNEIVLSLESLEKSLRTNKINQEVIEQIISRYPHWEKLVTPADFDVVRWVCHGHTGLSFIWSAYQKIVHYVSLKQGCEHPNGEVAKALAAKEDIRFNACAQKWIERSLSNEGVFPKQILQMLEIAI